jgi:hypothetical protein
LEASLAQLDIESRDNERSMQTKIECSGGPACQILRYEDPLVCKYWQDTNLYYLIPLKFGITRRGFEILLPPSAKEGDCLYRVHGDPTVLVLRPVHERPNHFHVVGSAAVNNMNRGGRIPKQYYDRRHKQLKPLRVQAPKPIILV